MSYTSKQAAQESQQVATSANKVVSPQFSDQRASTSVQLKQQKMMNAVQRAGIEEEPMQGKFATTQLVNVEDEEPIQGKFETAQLMEEEEPLQGKFETAQLVDLDEAEPVQGKFAAHATVQREAKPNNTGLPNQLKAGIESLSGMSMDSVKVHYNSDKPSQLNAHAYAQGTDIHVAPGQEQHVPHEAWHVVQQAQGRVKPTTQMKGTSVNDDVGLETEADVMGAKALSVQKKEKPTNEHSVPNNAVSQLYPKKFVRDSAKHHYGDAWGRGYKVQNDGQLKAKVSDSVAGSGELSLGIWYAPMVEQDINDRKKAKEVTICYEDGAKDNETAITHCGPAGKIYWSSWTQEEITKHTK